MAEYQNLNTQKYKCHKCKRLFNTISSLKFHCDQRKTSCNFRCHRCDIIFPNRYSLNYHLKNDICLIETKRLYPKKMQHDKS